MKTKTIERTRLHHKPDPSMLEFNLKRCGQLADQFEHNTILKGLYAMTFHARKPLSEILEKLRSIESKGTEEQDVILLEMDKDLEEILKCACEDASIAIREGGFRVIDETKFKDTFPGIENPREFLNPLGAWFEDWQNTMEYFGLQSQITRYPNSYSGSALTRFRRLLKCAAGGNREGLNS